MKAIEASEKLYISSEQILNKGLYHGFRDKIENTDIEYTRTDAFIEKAWDWIENNLLSSNQQDKSRLYFEQFVNYMKG